MGCCESLRYRTWAWYIEEEEEFFLFFSSDSVPYCCWIEYSSRWTRVKKLYDIINNSMEENE